MEFIMLYTKGETQCSPGDVGFSDKRLELLNNHFQKLVDDNEIYCATYCLSRKGKVFAHGGVGYKTYKKDPNLLVSPTDTHYIASITKTFAGIAIMKLVEDGVTRLDVAVGEILPQLNAPPFNGITLYHLLTHTSGMHGDGGCFPSPHNGSYWHFISTAYQAYLNDKSADKGEFDWIAAALAYGVRMVPDKEWIYCSFGFVLLGEIITKLTGVNCHKWIEDNICKPLGLSSTGFDITKDMAKRYIIHDEESSKHIEGVISGNKVVEEGDELWDTIPSTGGGMSSSVWDLVRYGNMVLHNGTFDGVRIIGRKAVEKMTNIAIQKPDFCWGGSGGLRSYGIGFDHRNGPAFSFSGDTFMHEGSGACALYIDPKEDLVASWIAPFVNRDTWCTRAMYSTVNVIWSGLI
jgi:CubicO group peptidase (beta-lactamase class C family)